ncbi:MAG: hypothetical protein CVU46_08605 [Chloroflexi bacterium HGW-Chloroflexi-8]|jgi:hypothetical protein|nr:MAG: hypothetical protein CVU46_08605 [Chloroflexi bacterium HGW-Chloroflexi-8]
MNEKTVDEYIAGLVPWQAEIVTRIREIIINVAPETKELYKWGQPVYENGGPLAYMKAFKHVVNFGFWRGADIVDPYGLLEGEGDKMRHLQFKRIDQINAEILSDFVRQAVRLNLEKGDPTKNK